MTFDWLEDSLLKKAPMRAETFLLSRRIKVEQKAKAEKAAMRNENISKGGSLHQMIRSLSLSLTSLLVRTFGKGCIDAKLEIDSGTITRVNSKPSSPC